MANKRMFSKSVINTDSFMDLSATAKVLYFYLNLAADDDGFVDNPRTVMLLSGTSREDFKQLVTQQFVLLYDDGLVVIRHWLIHNTIAKDRYTETEYLEQKAMLFLTSRKEYTFDSGDGSPIEIKNKEWAASHGRLLSVMRADDEAKPDECLNPPEPDEEASAAELEDKEETPLPEPDEEKPAAKKKTKKEKEKEEKEEKEKAITDIIEYLGKKTGRGFRPTTKSYRKYIGARLTEGYTPEELKLIIDCKYNQWKGLVLKNGTNMEKFLTPETLFSDEHCNSYLIDAKNSTQAAPAATPAAPVQQPAQAQPASMRSAVVEYEDDIDD